MASESGNESGNPTLGRRPEKKLRRLVWIAVAPGLLATGVLLGFTELSTVSRFILFGLVAAATAAAAQTLTSQWRFWLGTLSNLVSSLREEDYSFRARRASREDPMGELVMEINALADQLRRQRLDEREAAGLLRNVMQEIPVCVFTFDPNRRLRFVNRMGERALGQSSQSVINKKAEEVGLSECLNGQPNRTLELTFGGTLGRWGLRRATVRQEGLPQQLVVLTDLSRTLRDEERLAWQRIVRVIGHEVNNSLAPIQSLAASLDKLLSRSEREDDWERDLKDGLSVIRTRSEALSRLMQSYSRLARLPPPVLRPFKAAEWVHRAAALESRVKVEVEPGPDIILSADRDQLDQVLINLIANAVDAVLEDANAPSQAGDAATPRVRISWKTEHRMLTLSVMDNGPGVGTGDNLFVPFFTTKSGGSGIGLALCRQIVERHNGSLRLDNRKDGRGAEAILSLPIQPAP